MSRWVGSALLAFVWLCTNAAGRAQPSTPLAAGLSGLGSNGLSSTGLDSNGLNDERILGVIPNYQTVNEPDLGVAPLTVKQKFNLFAKETLDPFNLAGAAFGSAFSQAGNETPKYGRGTPALAERFGAAVGDAATQGLFSAAVLASVLHQDPRYFRRGPKSGVLSRVAYSVSRLAVARQDSGRETFNASGIFGMGLGIAASNVYYPAASRRGSVMAGRLTTSLTGGVVGNLMSEFWPDIQRKMSHRRHGS